MGLTARKVATSPEPIFNRVARAAAAQLYSPQIATNIKSNGNIAKKLGIGLTETPGKALAYGSFALAIGATVRNFIKFDEITSDLLDNAKRWALPVVSFAVSMLSTYFNYKGQKILESGLIDLGRKDDQKQIFDKTFEKLFKYLEKHPELAGEEEFDLSIFLANCEAALSSIDLGCDYQETSRAEWLETSLKQHLINGKGKYGLQVSLANKSKDIEYGFTPDTMFKIEFYNFTDNKVQAVNVSLKELISDGWLEKAPKWLVEKLSEYIRNYISKSAENASQELFQPRLFIGEDEGSNVVDNVSETKTKYEPLAKKRARGGGESA